MLMPIKRRYRLRKSEARQIAREAVEKLGEGVSGLFEEGVEILETEDGKEIILAEGKELFFRTRDGLFPILTAVDAVRLRRVVVDMGAVPHVANGADVMGPGVTSADAEIRAGDIVAVVDERHGKPISVGVALVSGSEMKTPKGKVVENVHHVGDEIWRATREKS